MNEAPPMDDAVHGSDVPVAASNGATIVLKRSGAETDIVFSVNPPAIIGRFDPTVGPIDIDLGGLPEGSYISRRHAKITLEDDVWMLHDLGSSNGTFILGPNDFERHESFALHDGTDFALGNARFAFHTAGGNVHAAEVPTLDAEPAPEEPAPEPESV
ncbi:MAG: FHA domain-containing protein [Fimbriimonadaceae bacterium]